MTQRDEMLNGISAMQLMSGTVLEDKEYTLAYNPDGREVFILRREESTHNLSYDFTHVTKAGQDSWELQMGDSKTGGKLFLNGLDEYTLLRKALQTIAKTFDN